MMTIEVVMADTCNNATSWINGTVKDADNSTVMPGVWVRNASNSASDLTTFSDDQTGTDGNYNLSCFEAGAAETLYFNKSGYTERSLIIAAYNGSAAENLGTILMTAVTPTVTGAAASSITRNTATYSWTVTATDNVSNNSVSNRLVWYASGIVNATKDWSNATTSPSFTFTNLREGQKYTVEYQAINSGNAGYRKIATTTFTTLKSNMGAIIEAEGAGAAPAPSKPKGIIESLTSPTKSPQQRNIIVVVIVVIIGVVAYFGWYVPSSGKGGKSRKK